MPIPVFSQIAIEQLRADHHKLKYMVDRVDARSRRMAAGGDAVYTSVAITTDIIPARVGTKAGGPITVGKQKLDSAGEIVDDRSIEVYSWVKTDSADPDDEPLGQLYIYISQDERGTWWFTGQDCTDPPVEILLGASTVDTPADLTIQPLLAVGSTNITVVHPGVYTYAMQVALNISNVLGNQAWDVALGIYSSIDADFVWTRRFAGTGTPVQPIFRINVTGPAEFSDAYIGDTLTLACQRDTTTGDVVVLAGSEHTLTGPL